jgi:transposase
MFYLGIDVSKAKLDCALRNADNGKVKTKVIPNTAEGFKKLLEWLTKNGAPSAHIIMEPTGVYHELAAFFFVDAGLTISLVNPVQLRKYAGGINVKTKTDKMDSQVLARFGAEQKPAPWEPPSAAARALKALLARRDAVADDLLREKNRQEKLEATETPQLVTESVEGSLKFIEAELKRLQKCIDDLIDNDPDMRGKRELLNSIPGVGERVSNHMTCLLAGRDFKSGEQLAAYLGLIPVSWESGTSVRVAPRMSKAGPAHLRKLLYMPAIVAVKRNPHIKALYERLLGRGKSKMSAIGAAMRKLAHLCFGVVKTGRAYDENFTVQP